MVFDSLRRVFSSCRPDRPFLGHVPEYTAIMDRNARRMLEDFRFQSYCTQRIQQGRKAGNSYAPLFPEGRIDPDLPAWTNFRMGLMEKDTAVRDVSLVLGVPVAFFRPATRFWRFSAGLNLLVEESVTRQRLPFGNRPSL